MSTRLLRGLMAGFVATLVISLILVLRLAAGIIPWYDPIEVMNLAAQDLLGAPDSRMLAASIGKSFVAAAALALQAEGGLDLDACRLVLERENLPASKGEYDDNKPEGVDAADVHAKCQVLGELVEAMVDKEASISVFSETQKYFSFWSNVHIFSTYFLFGMIGVHVLTTLYYGLRWLQ